MAQFHVYQNMSVGASSAIPLLLDVQTDLLVGLATRLVVPLYLESAYSGRPVAGIMLRFDIAGTGCIAVFAEMAGVPCKCLGADVADVSARRGEILRAFDLLISGF